MRVNCGRSILFILSGFYFTTAPGASLPNLLWPLDSTSYTTEVISSPSVPVDTSRCNMMFSDPPTGSPNQVLELSGSSYVDVNVSYPDIPNEDYSFSGRFRPTDNNGALFHYKANSGTGPFLDMMLYMNGGTLEMTRSLNGLPLEMSTTVTISVVLNTWNYVYFGFDISNGKMKVGLNGNKEIDEAFASGIDFISPGVLRIGGTFDQSQPNFKGQIACAAFWANEKDPPVTDAIDECEASSWATNTPDCTTSPALYRNDTAAGYFSAKTGIYLSTLNLMLTIQTCSHLKCAFECLRSDGCWYYRYGNSGSSCGDCMLYDSSVTSWRATGVVSTDIYKWRI